MTEQKTANDAYMSISPWPMHLSTMTHDLTEARNFYTNVLGCKERRASSTSAHFDWFGSQLTMHRVEGYNARNLHRDVDAEEVPVPHFGVALDEETFHEIANRLQRVGWTFILDPHKRFIDKGWEQWVMFVLDPSGNAIELKSFTKIPSRAWA
jgi:extradiol dioxygenase family protein